MKYYQRFSALLLLAALTTACGKANDSAKASGPPPTNVQVRTVQNATQRDSTEYVGTLEAEKTVNLKPQIDGRIDQILVRPGTRVNQGDVIFTLNLDQTATQLNSAQASVNAAAAAQNTSVQQVQVARSQLTSAQSQYELAQLNNNRYQALAKQGAIAQATADQYATNAKVALDAVKQARDQLQAAQASVNQAQANVRKAQADANTARVSVNFKQVVAPIAGTVGNITLKSGDYVTTGQTLTTINQNGTFDLQIPIPLSRSGQLRTGLSVALLDPNTGDSLGSGTIYFVSPQADATQQVIYTRARFANPAGKLRDSQYVRAQVIWSTKPGILVPTTAVNTIGGQNFVFVMQTKDQDGKQQTVAQQVPVTLGNIQGQDYQVLKGIDPGAKVITSGVSKLRDGALVQPQSGPTQQAQS